MRALLLAGLLLAQGCGWYFLERDPSEVPKGAPAPAFALDSTIGATSTSQAPGAGPTRGPRVTLDDLRARGHAVLVFYRGHW